MSREDFETLSGKKIRSPLWLRILVVCVAFICITGYFVCKAIDWKRNDEKFYKEGFSSLVMTRELYQGRTNEYHLANGLEIFFWLSDTTSLAVGDSVVKNSQTFIFNVYRRNGEGQYVFLAKYNYDELP
eukprot:TRINITY_DN83448_c0_g1_i1.p1 TRINITY_DN83448_c0_g1~~TRINITY_DN83448_c0_g1_i1.p1  ORF type:complete len:129 (+),score=2.77 TRINITY_DN83448_c0_g1_i1:91-477(+)